MPTITWDKYNKCLVDNGFTDEQIEVLGEIIPHGFADRLRAVGLDPRTFRLSVGEKVEKSEKDNNQLPIFEGTQV